MDNNSVARVYQFLSKNYTSLNDWKQEVDEAGYGKNDGILTKYEVRKYLENEFALDSNFFNEKDDNIDDIVNRFWASIDTKTIGNVGLTGVSNKNALDNDEIAKMELGLQAADRVRTFMLTKRDEIDALDIEDKDKCYESIKSGVLNKLLNRIKESGNITSLDTIDDSVLEGFYKTVSKTAVADYAARETINKELQNIDYDNDDYKIDDDKTWQKIRDTFVRGFINDGSSITLDDIIDGAKDLAAAYADTAKTNSQASVDKLGSTYNTHKLNELQVAVLTKSIKDKIYEKLDDKLKSLYESEIDAKIPAFITKELSKKTASGFTTIDVDSLADKFIANEIADINAKYKELTTKRDELIKYVTDELGKEDHTEERNAAAQKVFQSTDIKVIEQKIKTMNLEEVQQADTDFRAEIAAIGGNSQQGETNVEDKSSTIKDSLLGVKRNSAIMTYRILNDGTVEFVKLNPGNVTGGIFAAEADTTVNGYFNEVKTKLESANGYQTELNSIFGSDTNAKNALFNTALYMTLSDSTVVKDAYHQMPLRSVVDKVVDNYVALLQKASKDEKFKKYIIQHDNLSLIAGRTLATEDIGRNVYIDDVNGTMTRNMNDYYKDNSTAGSDDWAVNLDDLKNNIIEKDGIILFKLSTTSNSSTGSTSPTSPFSSILNSTSSVGQFGSIASALNPTSSFGQFGSIASALNSIASYVNNNASGHEKDLNVTNEALMKLLSDYLDTYKDYISPEKIIDLFKQAELNMIAELQKANGTVNLNDKTTRLYGYSESGGKNDKNYADYDTYSGTLFSVQAVLLQTMFEMERLIGLELLNN